MKVLKSAWRFTSSLLRTWGNVTLATAAFMVPALAVTLILYLIFGSQQPNHGATALKPPPSEQDITKLPAGVEKRWLQYIDNRLSSQVKREGQMLRVRNWQKDLGEVYVSLNQPYRVGCSDYDVGVDIAFGERGSYVVLAGSLSDDRQNEPTYGVPPDSSAARKLAAKVCDHAAQRLAELTRP